MAQYVIGAISEITIIIEADTADEALQKARDTPVKDWDLDCEFPSFPEIMEGPDDEFEKETD